MKLQADCVYKTRNGDEVKIQSVAGNTSWGRLKSEGYDTVRSFCTHTGSYTFDESRPCDWDIVELLGREVKIGNVLDFTDFESDAVVNEPAPVYDEVEHPEHYTSGGIECIEAIRAALTPEEFRGYCKGAMIKYIWRERLKQGNTSIEKAVWYGREMLK